jgi:large subunit ribosomal protein L24
MARIRKGDTVIVRAGADKGRRGRVIRVLPDRSKAVVEGLNLVHKHLKKSQKHPQGGRIRREAPLPLSKLTLVDPATGEGTRVSWKVVDGEKRRVSRKGGGVIAVDTKARTTSAKQE